MKTTTLKVELELNVNGDLTQNQIIKNLQIIENPTLNKYLLTYNDEPGHIANMTHIYSCDITHIEDITPDN